MIPQPDQNQAALSVGPSPLLRTASNEDIEKEDQAKQNSLMALQGQPQIVSLSDYILKAWEAAKNAKITIEQLLFECARQREGVYDPADLAIINEQGGSGVYMMLTAVKCRSIEGGIKDVMLPGGGVEHSFSVGPTPIPNMQEDVEEIVMGKLQMELQTYIQQGMPNGPMTPTVMKRRLGQLRQETMSDLEGQARQIASRQCRYIADAFVEGGYINAMNEFIKDFATYPTAFFKGPIIEADTVLDWVQTRNGTYPMPVTKLVRKFKRVSPFDIYPSPGSKNLDDGYLVERMRLRRRDLIRCLNVPGFKNDAIEAVLSLYGESGFSSWLWTDEERKKLEYRPDEHLDPEAVIEALAFNGWVRGRKLLEWGMTTKQVPDQNLDYHVTAYQVGKFTIMARLNNHPLNFRGYYSASYESKNDSIWGKGPPQMMRDCAKMCNAAARSTSDNMAITSGPQVEVQMDRLDATEDARDIYPWKIWKTKSNKDGKTNTPAVYFYQPNGMTRNLMEVYNHFYLQAGEQVGVPAYEHGSTNTKGAGETAKGLSMLMQASSKIIKDAIRNIDNQIIIPLVYTTWLHLVMHQVIKEAGDINIIARASEYMLMHDKIQAFRRDWLMITNNPTDMAIIGMMGRAEVLRETAKGLRMPIDNIIPAPEVMQAKLLQEQNVPPKDPNAEEKDGEEKPKAIKPSKPKLAEG